MENKLVLLLVIATIAGLILVCTLLLALYIVLCEYYALKFHYLTPKKSGMVNKSSGYSSATIIPSLIGATGGKGGEPHRGIGRGGGGGGGSSSSIGIDSSSTSGAAS